MPLLLTNDDIRKALDMADCLRALDEAYKGEGLGTAANRTKSTIYGRVGEGQRAAQYVTMEGGLRQPPVFALRLRAHPALPGRGGAGANALMLFSGETGELLALLEQRVISSYRVGATAGLAAREMARKDAKVVGIVGSGGLAHGHALAYAAVRKVELFKVYSRTPEHRRAFAEWITEMTGVPAKVMDGIEPVVRGSDIVAACTNSPVPIIKGEWLDTPGVHMTGVQLGDQGELEPAGLRFFQRLVTYLSDVSVHLTTEPGFRPWMSGTNQEQMERFKVIPHHHKLADVLLGRAPGRESRDENNYHFSEGTGVQFAATAAVIYQRARERGVGQEMPPEFARWFQPRAESF